MNEELPEEQSENKETNLQGTVPVTGMYKDWFLDYASYVILERAVPAIEDGLKPVQRRILHAMKEMDDGRFNKVANIIGQSMQYHPHGDASIGDAIVNLGQKNLLIETQATGAMCVQVMDRQPLATSRRACRNSHWRLYLIRRRRNGSSRMMDESVSR
ncbi:DNA topoisomerase IV subunit A [Nitritalea halalkaliphila LW7]|uniref:DNA topoisomerase IV subunit A n=1 Tax=Nitritalea halalkaliphila LW7 TaxID=1189621 RepID=I5C6W5_9BACT|nr:DNA topoisomerase IV subunit A [Nitritalea halalkaliphila LW7]